MKPRFSIIVPVYNRIDEVRDLLESLDAQQTRNFEVVLVEDGSSEPCRSVAEEYAGRIPVKYFSRTTRDGR